MDYDILPTAVNTAKITPPIDITAITVVSCAEVAPLVPRLVTHKVGFFVGSELDAPNL